MRWVSGTAVVALAVAGCGGGGGEATPTATASAQLNPVAAFALAQQSVAAQDSPAPVAPASTNMVSNPGFESGTTGWGNWGNARVVSGEASSGTSALSVGPDAGGAGQLVPGIVPGNTYRLTAQAKVSATSETVYVGINFVDASGIPFTQNSVVVASTAYTTASVDVVAPPDAVNALVYVWKNAGTGIAYVDDFTFGWVGAASPQAAVPGNLVANGGFDAGLAAWENWGNTVVSSDGVAPGQPGVQVGTGAGGFGQHVRGIVPGKSYRVSALARVSSLSNVGYLGVVFEDDAGTALLAQNVVLRSTTDSTAQLDVTAPPGTTRALVFVWKNAGAGLAYVDNVALTELAPAESNPSPPPGPEVPMASGNITPVLLDGGYVVWQQDSSAFNSPIATLRLQRYGPDGQPSGSPVSITVPSNSSFVPLTGGGYALVSLSSYDGHGLYGVYTQTYTSTGAPIGRAGYLGLVNPGAEPTPAAVPQVAPLTDGGYVVVWGLQQKPGSDVDTSVYAQRYGADNTPMGSGAIQVTTEGTGFLGVTGLTTGGFLVTWGNLSGTEGGARAYTAWGEPLTTAQDAGSSWNQGAGPRPALAPLAGGGAVMAWQVPGDLLQEQPFMAAGLPYPAQVVDSLPTTPHFINYSASGLPGGGYVVAWVDGNDRNVYARRYALDGTPVSARTRINLVTTNAVHSDIVALPDGRFMVSWLAGNGVRYARTFPADGLTAP